MTLYALEGLLARIARSEYRDDFVLKGGVLLAAFAARRPTKGSRREDELPEAFGDVLAAVAGFADPVLAASATGRWNPAAKIWE